MRGLFGLMLLAASAVAAGDDRNGELLGEHAYRGGVEELVVTATVPKWRVQEPVEPDWRKHELDLSATRPAPMEWLPEYTAEERDQYNGVRDRMGEKPTIKLFEFKF